MTFLSVKRLALALSATALLATSACFAQTPPANPVLAGTYKVDPTHVSLTFKVSHFGLSNYTARFATVNASLTYDPADPTKSQVTASIDPTSIRTDHPVAETKIDFDKELAGDKWFNAAKFPAVTFKSTKIEVTGERTGRMTGDLTLLGVTKPVTLDVTLNAAMDAHPMRKVPVLGFSASGAIDRTAFGLSAYAPYVGAEVKIQIEAEFLKQ